LYKYDDLVLDEKGYKRAIKDEPYEYKDDDRSIAKNENVDDRSIVDNDITDDDVFITVVKGDTLYSIARSNNLSVDDLKRINGLDSNELSIGMKLLVTK
jgi:LysM repeat protein